MKKAKRLVRPSIGTKVKKPDAPAKDSNPATTSGREAALAKLAARRANQPRQINNAGLPAGSPMYFYCVSCGHESDVLPESYVMPPKRLCSECQALQDLGWLQ